MSDVPLPPVERAYHCYEPNCKAGRLGWIRIGPEPEIRCTFCSSTMIVFAVVPWKAGEAA